VGAALAAANVGEAVHAMHDPTEGGLATGLFELVAPAGLGLRVIREHIPVFPETDTICDALALDPLKLIASGALLITVAPDRADSVLTAIEATGVSVVVIGEVRPSGEGITIMTNGAPRAAHAPSSRRDRASLRRRLGTGGISSFDPRRIGCV
jgi:hydrogenase expression/formation protein HypE